MKDQFPDDWVTKGWSRGPEGKWIELGGSAGVTVDGVEVPPTLSIHDVADKLNALEIGRMEPAPLIVRLRCGEEEAVRIAVRRDGGRLVDFYPDATAYRDYIAAHDGRQVDFEIQEQ